MAMIAIVSGTWLKVGREPVPGRYRITGDFLAFFRTHWGQCQPTGAWTMQSAQIGLLQDLHIDPANLSGCS
jgi:hypothetical protein